jgi:predicted NUDIX family phosphoesterase
MTEDVMVFSADLLGRVGYFQGISFEPNKYLEIILNDKSLTCVERRDAEKDPSVKQLVSYVIVRHYGNIFTYRRGKLLAEQRLLGKYSIGLGGHISMYDSSLFGTTVEESMFREVNEEVEITSPYHHSTVALINDDTTSVGAMHFGIVHIITLENPLIKPKEKSINETKFLSFWQLRRNRSRFENWSQICINELGTLLQSNCTNQPLAGQSASLRQP